MSFWGNSGVFIFGAVEIQIIDTRGMLATLVPAGYSFQVDDDGTVRPVGSPDSTVYEAENIGYLLTGVPYLHRPSGLSDPTTGLRLSDCPLIAGWNQMEIDVTPIYNQACELSRLKVSVKVNGKQTFSGIVDRKTGGNPANPVPLTGVTDRTIQIQSHWGSEVRFRNVTIARKL